MRFGQICPENNAVCRGAQIREQMSGPEISYNMKNQFWAVGCGLGLIVK